MNSNSNFVWVSASALNLRIKAFNDFHVSGPTEIVSNPVPFFFRCQLTQSFGFTNYGSSLTLLVTGVEQALVLTYNPTDQKCWVPFTDTTNGDFDFTSTLTSPLYKYKDLNQMKLV